MLLLLMVRDMWFGGYLATLINACIRVKASSLVIVSCTANEWAEANMNGIKCKERHLVTIDAQYKLRWSLPQVFQATAWHGLRHAWVSWNTWMATSIRARWCLIP